MRTVEQAETALGRRSGAEVLEYLRLDPLRIQETAQVLHQRIVERFPERNLRHVAADLCAAVNVARLRIRRLHRPHIALRTGVALVLLGVPLLVLLSALRLPRPQPIDSLGEYIQSVEAAIASAIFLGAAALFLLTLEGRLKRRIALRGIDEIRALAHVVDMHQLTKDPDRLARPEQDTASSPERALAPFQLARYLDYCTEILSLASKVGALYGQDSPDVEIAEAVDDLDSLTSNMIARIWQKNALLHQLYPAQIAQNSAAPAATKL